MPRCATSILITKPIMPLSLAQWVRLPYIVNLSQLVIIDHEKGLQFLPALHCVQTVALGRDNVGVGVHIVIDFKLEEVCAFCWSKAKQLGISPLVIDGERVSMDVLHEGDKVSLV